MNTANKIYCLMMVSFIHMAASTVHAEMVYYSLDNVILDDTTQMTGIFSWTFETNDFENGVGQFVSLVIPWTSHNQDDLDAAFDMKKSIEITLPGNVHGDGVDITLVLTQPLTPTTSSLIATNSAYDIGGDGFYAGGFLSGTISPTNLVLSIAPASPGFAALSWEPAEIPGYVLQENPGLSPTNWTDSASGSTNPIVVSATEPTKFYRLAKP